MNAPATMPSCSCGRAAGSGRTISPVEAIEHALQGGDVEHAAELLELRCLDMTYTGKLQLVCQFAARIPEQVLQPLPRILLSVSWMLTLNLRLEEARRNFSIVDRFSAASMNRRQPRPRRNCASMRYLLLHRQMILAVAEDDAPRVEQRLPASARSLPGGEASLSRREHQCAAAVCAARAISTDRSRSLDRHRARHSRALELQFCLHCTAREYRAVAVFRRAHGCRFALARARLVRKHALR